MRGPPILGLLGLALALAAPAGAASFTTELSEFSGADAVVRVTLDDRAAGPGKVQVVVELVETAEAGGLEGLSLNIGDDSLLSGLVVTGNHVSSFGVVGGQLLSDIIIEFGSTTLEWEELRTTTIVLSHLYEALDLSLFEGEEIRVRLVGGNESIKTVTIVPEPGTGWLMAAGLIAMGGIRRRGPCSGSTAGAATSASPPCP